MGLSSSQARLLNLTTRMHQIEYKAAKLEAEKLQMANESDRVYNEYLDALEMTKMQRKALNSDGSVTYVDINSRADLEAAGVYLCKVTADGLEVVDTDTVSIDDQNVPINSKTLMNLINSGQFVLSTINGEDIPGDALTSISTNTNLQEVQDESVLRIAEAKYEADMKKIDRKERKFDSDLASLDNERNAIKQEMDTLKTVAKDNVERTFKLFS